MSGTPQGEIPTRLDPILEAAMNDLTTWVYDAHVTTFLHPRQLTTHRHLDAPDGAGRAACVAMFKNLKHFGVEWDTAALCEWATRRGWVPKDIAQLREFGNGIQSGSRYHAGPAPWARSEVQSWLRGVPDHERTRPTRRLRIKSCCRTVADAPPSRAEKMDRPNRQFKLK